MFDIEENLKKLPDKPGVYLMKDKEDKVLYVGKAILLKKRVVQYFRKNSKSARIEKMVSLIHHFEYVITDSEAEALILECNLIKEYRPKFNVLLKDDKTYPYIKVDIKSEFPSISITRKMFNDGAKYFGPYADAGSAKEMVDFIKQKIQIRQCKYFKAKQRECLNYHIGRCMAPCAGKISKAEYEKQIGQIIMLLEGKTENILEEIEMEIQEASSKLLFEKAAYLRDKKLAIERMKEKQKVSNISENDIDVIGIAKNEIMVCIEIFFVRHSKMIGREQYFLNGLTDMEDTEILAGFLKQFYLGKENFPSKIMLKEKIESQDIFEEWLSKQAGKKVEMRAPKKGEKLRFVEMAEKNAKIALENKIEERQDILEELKEVLGLEVLPKKIESFDISNLSGSFIVAGMCVAESGKVKRNLSRRFKIRTQLDQDDPRCMEEVIIRRLKHSVDGESTGFGMLPDLLLLDGGKLQIDAGLRAVQKYHLAIPVYGLVKNEKHMTRAIMDCHQKEYEISEALKNFVTNLQEEVHKVAIEYHRKLRDQEMTKSELDEIPGIGKAKKEALLKAFHSIKNIKAASIEELTKVKGISIKLAKEIKEK